MKALLSNVARKAKSRFLVAAMVLLAVVATSDTSSGAGSATQTSDPAAKILADIGSPRLDSLTISGTTIEVKGEASGPSSDATRTLWYEAVAAAAYAQEVPGIEVDRQVLDTSESVIAKEDDSITPDGPDAFAPLTRSDSDLQNEIGTRAQAVDSKLIDFQYIKLYGGIGEIVVQPADVVAFTAAAGENVSALLGDLAQNQQPYLVTVVDDNLDPYLVLGYNPSVGGTGQGVAWQAPGAKSDAVWGAPVPTK
ncbi:MAG: hypothetical protein M3P26_15375 [Gemmatimonadota bacterium]|nr:hypothetical protein [Gemmatimonadota bacterium]